MKSRSGGASSLWLARPRTPLTARLDRWASYPYFLESLAQYGALPDVVEVRFGPFADFTRHGFDEEEDWDFVDEVMGGIKRGEDVPPLIREAGAPSDGMHRAWAARRLGMRMAPIVELVRP